MEANSEPENPGSPEGQQVLAQPGAPSTKPGQIPTESWGGSGRVWLGARPRPSLRQAPPQTTPPSPAPCPRPSCEAGNRAALSRCCCRAVRSSVAESCLELGRRGCTRSRDPATRDLSLRRRRRLGRPRPHHGEGDVQLCAGPEGGQEGRAQEQRGGAHRPSRCRGGGLQGPGWGRGRGPRGGDGGARTALSSRVPWCVCSGRGGVLALATPRGDSCTGVRAPAALHLAWSPGNLQRQAPPPPPSLALFFQYKYCA